MHFTALTVGIAEACIDETPLLLVVSVNERPFLLVPWITLFIQILFILRFAMGGTIVQLMVARHRNEPE